MRTLSYLAFRVVVFMFSLIPFGLLYITSDILSFILFKLIRYRRKVIRKNLLFCFPAKSFSELEEIENQFFKNFTDILIESLKAFSCSTHTISKRYKITNPEILDTAFKENEDVVLLTQHFGNWEWGGYCLGNMINNDIVVMYKSLSHPLVNRFVKKKREGKNINLVSNSRQLFNNLNAHRNVSKAIIFVIDQYPANIKKIKKVGFFNKKISFNNSAILIAEHISAKCYFLDIKRVKRGRYELEIKQPTAINRSPDLTNTLDLYAQHLEDLITKNPEQWMWTHKRFKDDLEYN